MDRFKAKKLIGTAIIHTLGVLAAALAGYITGIGALIALVMYAFVMIGLTILNRAEGE